MKVTNVERQPGSIVVMTIEVEPEEFAPAMEQSVKKNVSKITVPGFRKGKAPRKMIVKIYGTGIFFEDAVDIVYPKVFTQAIQELGIEPLEPADVSVKEISENGFTFEAKVPVYPEVTLGQYKGLAARLQKAEADDESVDAEIKRLRDRNASLTATERAAAIGDTVLFDFEGFVDDVAFEGGKAEGHTLELGSGRFIPGFEEQLAGHSAGESFDVNVMFPEEYHSEALAGKAAVFKCVLHEVKEKILPELDDEFAKDVSEFDTVDELKADIRRKLLDSRQKANDDAYENTLVDQLIAGMTADVPQVMIEQQLETLMSNFSYRLSSSGMNIDSYLAMTGMQLEDLRRDYLPIAERQVKASLAFDAVADAEKLEASDEEVEAEYAKMAEQYNMPIENVKKAVSANHLKNDMRGMKAAQFIKDNAVEGDPAAPLKVDAQTIIGETNEEKSE